MLDGASGYTGRRSFSRADARNGRSGGEPPPAQASTPRPSPQTRPHHIIVSCVPSQFLSVVTPRPSTPGRTMQVEFSVARYTVKLKNGEKKMILENIRGRARKGEVLALMGPSGAGKSTLVSSHGDDNRRCPPTAGPGPPHSPCLQRSPVSEVHASSDHLLTPLA